MFQANFHLTNQRFTAEFNAPQRFNANGLSERINSPYTYYNGNTVITPSRNQQTILCENMVMSSNVVVKPIPENYGLISWNGSYLSVS